MTNEPAARFVDAFGDLEAMESILADDVVYRLVSRMNAGPFEGRDAVLKFLDDGWSTMYDGTSISTETRHEVGDADASAIWITFSARFAGSGDLYRNEYVIFATARDGLITSIDEMPETSTLLKALRTQREKTT